MELRLNLQDYDHFSFSLENTLCEYNVNTLYSSQCRYLLNYIKKVKHFRKIRPILKDEDISFISRGLLIDFENGNLLKLNKNGVIVRASHGTRMLDKAKIIKIYGNDSKWSHISEIMYNPMKLISKRNLKKMMSLMDFTTASLALVYGKAIDSAAISGKTFSQVRHDFFEAVHNMEDATSSWSKYYLENVSEFVYRQEPSVIEWLRTLKSIGCTSLITSNDEELTQKVAAHTLGNNWKELFNCIVYSSEKPYFFNGNYLNHSLKSVRGSNPISFQREYCGGSFDQVENVLAAKIGRRPHSIFFGSSPVYDLMPTANAVSIVEESAAENFIHNFRSHKQFLTSAQWGSLFHENRIPTWFGNVVLNTNFCAPSLLYFSQELPDLEYKLIWHQ